MNRYEYAKEIVLCDVCHGGEAVKWRLCEPCMGAYVSYYNYTLNNKRDPKQPMSPEEYVRYKHVEKEVRAVKRNSKVLHEA